MHAPTPAPARRPKGATLARRFAMLFGGQLLATLTLAIIAFTQVSAMGDHEAETIETIDSQHEAFSAVTDALWQVRVQAAAMALMTPEQQAASAGAIAESAAAFDESYASFVAGYEAAFGMPVEEDAEALAAWEGFKTGKMSGGAAVDLDTFNALVQRAVDGLNEQLEAREVELLASTTDRVDSVKLTVALFAAFAILLGATFAVRMLVRIMRSVTSVKTAVEAMAGGDLTVEARVTSNDEIGRMAAAVNAAQVSLRETMSGVVTSAVTVAAAAEELSAANAQVSAGSQETSARAGVVANAADEVNRSVQAVAAGAEQMGASIKEISHNANEAARVAAQATGVAEATNEKVARLGASSQEIGDVIKVISSIAEQTNLLALNATIEAARAGEAGKGFAVVAGEVKDLAQETAKATEEVARRVSAIQEDTGGAVEAIGEISEIVKQINDFQLTIASAVEEQTATTAEMSRGVAEAATGSSDIAGSISTVAQASSDAAAVLDQIGASVAELAELSADLRAKVETFTY
ncbi:methyl-accepting chemotaxis protein [Demequina gelatinilytica]|uniref:methyl-accepting chemotaxis protein n=1 Tax=Demequina gelatinilytica TaxID=1638980 RepID=UPI00078523A3|nr:methyl-accepting chemotaxis protein [Demequina gelatinilytica]